MADDKFVGDEEEAKALVDAINRGLAEASGKEPQPEEEEYIATGELYKPDEVEEEGGTGVEE